MFVKERKTPIIDVGQVILANPFTNFYQIRPALTFDSAPKVLDATAMGGLAGRRGGVSVQETFQVGDSVIYTYKKDDLNDQTFGQVTIIGKCSPFYTFSSKDMNRMAGSGVDSINSKFYYVPEEQLQRTFWPHDNNATGFLDLMGGDWAVYGQQSGILVSDGSIGIRSGQVSFVLDALGRSLTESSLLRNINTIGSEESISIYDSALIYTSKYAGKIKDAAYGGLFEEGNTIIVANEKVPPKYPIQSTLSDALYASEENIVVGLDQIVASDQKRFDGVRTISTAMGLSMERDSYLSRYQYGGRRFEHDDKVNLDNREVTDPQKALEKSEIWTKGEHAQEAPDFQYTPVPKDKPEVLKEAVDVFEDDLGKHRAAPGQAHIRLLPSGGISLRDAWGSEILMEGGNIQISASNNLIKFVGRDDVNIVTGVSTTNADAIQMGAATHSVDIYGKMGTKIGSGGRTTLEGMDLFLFGQNSSVNTSPLIQMTSKSLDDRGSGAGIQMFSEEAPIAVVGNSLLLRGESGVVACGGNSAISVSGSNAVIGASNTQVIGALSVTKGSFSVTVPSEAKGSTNTVNVSGGNNILQVEGAAIIGGMIKGNDSMSVCGNIVTDTMAAKNVNQYGGIGKTQTKQEKAKITGGKAASSVSGLTSSIANAVVSMFKQIKKEVVKKARFGFHISTQSAVTVNEPIFSGKGGSSPMIATVAVDGDGNETYIYPGEQFWTKNGMWKYIERPIVMPEKDEEKSPAGAEGLKGGGVEHIGCDEKYYVQ